MSTDDTSTTAAAVPALSEGLGPLVEAEMAAYYEGEYMDHSVARERLKDFAAAVQAAERERLAGGNDLEAMCEAFHRLIEAHANLRSPFHQPVCADAQMALRVLRGIVAGLRS